MYKLCMLSWFERPLCTLPCFLLLSFHVTSGDSSDVYFVFNQCMVIEIWEKNNNKNRSPDDTACLFIDFKVDFLKNFWISGPKELFKGWIFSVQSFEIYKIFITALSFCEASKEFEIKITRLCFTFPRSCSCPLMFTSIK